MLAIPNNFEKIYDYGIRLGNKNVAMHIAYYLNRDTKELAVLATQPTDVSLEAFESTREARITHILRGCQPTYGVAQKNVLFIEQTSDNKLKTVNTDYKLEFKRDGTKLDVDEIITILGTQERKRETMHTFLGQAIEPSKSTREYEIDNLSKKLKELDRGTKKQNIDI
jgi:hypothetical protein